MKEILFRNVPTIPNDQTSDFLLYFLLETESGAIQQIGPIFVLVLSNQTKNHKQKKMSQFIHCYQWDNVIV
jgi:hypothetical protein